MLENIERGSSSASESQNERIARVIIEWGLEPRPLQGASPAQVSFAERMREKALLHLDSVALRFFKDGQAEVDVQSRFKTILGGPLGCDAGHWLAHNKRAQKLANPVEYWFGVWQNTAGEPLKPVGTPTPPVWPR
jgi:hypothetical protein